jgi:error-prone DNA polymerase
MTWLKHYYLLEFFVAIFNQQPMGFYNLETLKEDARRHGVPVLNPDINASVEKCVVASSVLDGTDGAANRNGHGVEEALLVGFLNVSGIGEAAARAIVEARERGGRYTSLGDAMRRMGLQRESIENLVLAGAFDSLTSDRRSALWEVGLRYRPAPLVRSTSNGRGASNGAGRAMPKAQRLPRQQPLELPVEQDMAPLTPMTGWEEMAGEYQTMSLYPKGHLMEHMRPHLSRDILPSDDLPHLEEGMDVWVAGLVIRRQRPLGKTVFITLEDEFGHVPLIVWPKVYARYRLVLREPVLKVRGKVSRREGTLNIAVTHAESLRSLRATPSAKNWG